MAVRVHSLGLTVVAFHHEKLTKLTVGVFYISPCSTAENDLNLFALISRLCTAKVGNLLCLGDFNWPNIDWSTWTPSSKSGSEF